MNVWSIKYSVVQKAVIKGFILHLLIDHVHRNRIVHENMNLVQFTNIWKQTCLIVNGSCKRMNISVHRDTNNMLNSTVQFLRWHLRFYIIPCYSTIRWVDIFQATAGGKWQRCSMADSSDWETVLLCGWVCLAFKIIFAMPFCRFHPKFLELSHCTRASCCKLLWWNNKRNNEK